MPEWLQGLVKFQYFLHYFKKEMSSLPIDILKEVHDSMQLGTDNTDNILYISKIPKKADGDLDKDWVRARILQLVNDHHSRILLPNDGDLVFVDEDEDHFAAVLFLDSFGYMRAATAPDEYPEDVEAIPGEDDEIVLEDPEKKKEEEPEPMPTEYSCGVCTFLNALDSGTCSVCGSPAPPMSQIMADFKANLAQENPGAKPGKSEEAEEEEQSKTPNQERLALLARDISRCLAYE